MVGFQDKEKVSQTDQQLTAYFFSAKNELLKVAKMTHEAAFYSSLSAVIL